MTIEELGKQAFDASKDLLAIGSEQKNLLLKKIADAICENTSYIIAQNNLDLENGKKSGLSDSLLDRLMLNKERLKEICDAVINISRQEDPVGAVLEGQIRPNGLKIQKITVPLGVVGIIYEARPNVTVDAAALCLKSGNACILRGGKEAINSNMALVKIMREAIFDCGFNKDAICLVEDTSRESAMQLMKLNKYLSVLIPRGGAGLIKSVVENSSVPVIETGSGNCHVYIDKYANLDMAAEIVYNAKASRVSVCNAAETMIIHKSIAESFLPVVKKELDKKNVLIKGCEATREIIEAQAATEDDYYKEFSDYIIACIIVDDIDAAIKHIAKYSTGHSECIVTENYRSSKIFTSLVDSAAVYVNVSTRFTDGGEFGLGAEVGISTQKLHARGPMGIKALTSYKYIIEGTGQTR